MTPAIVSQEKLKENKWFSIHGRVYDISAFDDHPGGKEILLALAGKDATADFEDVGHSDSARKQAASFFIGFLEGAGVDAKDLPSVAEISSNASKSSLSTGTVVLSGMFALVAAIAAYFAFGAKKH